MTGYLLRSVLRLHDFVVTLAQEMLSEHMRHADLLLPATERLPGTLIMCTPVDLSLQLKHLEVDKM